MSVREGPRPNLTDGRIEPVTPTGPRRGIRTHAPSESARYGPGGEGDRVGVVVSGPVEDVTPGDRHRAAILEAAVELFHEVPLREVTVRRIAERAGVNPSLI